jgi:EpsI family protein
MSRPIRAGILMAVLMSTTSLFAYSARPTRLLADVSPRAALAEELPKEFKRWRKLPARVAVVSDPTRQAVLNYLYSETLAANYVDANDRLAMLSIAYGKDQSDGHDVHKPDLCYPAQGFRVIDERDLLLPLDERRGIVVRYMTTQNGERVEPLIFWTTVGDFQYRNKLEKKLIGIRYSAANLIPDGMVLRVSTLERDPEVALAVLTDFVQDWYEAMPEQRRSRYFGDANQ